VLKRKTRTKTPWTREFKLRALARMDEAADVTALAASLGCRRELLYIWRRKYRSGGAQALHPIGRRLNAAKALDEALAPSLPGVGGSEQQRLEALERKIGQQQLDLDFFCAALRRVREQRLKTGVPGETASTR
jgi:transposase